MFKMMQTTALPDGAATRPQLKSSRGLSLLHVLQFSPQLARSWRSLTLSALFLALSGSVSVTLSYFWHLDQLAHVAALRILAYGCWMFGVLGSWTFLGRGAVFEGDLGRLRGHHPVPAWTWGALVAAKLAQGLALAAAPGIVLAGLLGGVFASPTDRLAFVVCAGAYALSVALFAGILVVAARAVSLRRARWVAIFLVGGSWVLEAFQLVPSSPIGWFLGGFSRLLLWGQG